jgi:hypothetical protein
MAAVPSAEVAAAEAEVVAVTPEVAVEAAAVRPLAAEAAVAAVTSAAAGDPAVVATHGTAADGRVDGMVAIIVIVVAVSGRALAPV